MSAELPENNKHVESLPENYNDSAYKRARMKAYWRLIPIIFLCYVIAYIDRSNVSIAKINMCKDIPVFTDEVFGIASGIFFLGYFLLEIPGSLIVERWSARKWICRIMVTWGIIAAMTAFVKTPAQFYTVRFLLGLAEAGFFPGVIVFLTHWFTPRDRARALAYFFIGSPIAQVISPKISGYIMKIGTEGNPQLWGLVGWQWVYIFWGIPAVILGLVVLWYLPDKPRYASWLTKEESDALENELQIQALNNQQVKHFTVLQALSHPKVLLLCWAYFMCVTASYGVEMFLPSILESWYNLKLDQITTLVILPHALSLVAQLSLAFSSDINRERRYHTVLPILTGAAALAFCPWSNGSLLVTVGLFMIAVSGLKGYLPVFWSLPTLILSKSGAAASIGLINSVGNLGGFLGPYLLGKFKQDSGSYGTGLILLACSMFVSATIIFLLNLKEQKVESSN